MSHIESKKATELPVRFRYAKNQIELLGYKTMTEPTCTIIEFEFNGAIIKFFPYTGWASGKSIKDGRGIHNLLRQINQ